MKTVLPATDIAIELAKARMVDWTDGPLVELRDVVLKALFLRIEIDAYKINKREEMIRELILQIEYLHEKFQETGSGNSVIDSAKRLLGDG